jgi:molybdate transport system ATP-binding protein
MSWRIRLELKRSAAFRLAVDLNLQEAGFTVVFGPSGSGKTTLLRAVAGLEKEARGMVALGGRILQDDDKGIRLPAHHRRLGMVFQNGALFPHLDVAGNLDFAAGNGPARTLPREEIISMLELQPLLERRVNELSGGERQRAALGRALLAGPDALLLDEPLASLDRAGRQAIYPYLERLHRAFARPCLHVTHDLEEAARLGDHLVLMQDGQITTGGPLNQVLTRPRTPLATGPRACSILETRLLAGPDSDGLLRLAGPGTDLWVPGEENVRGPGPVRLLVQARDVSLALAAAEGSSILNLVPVVVDEIWEDGKARVMVRLQAADQVLLAAVTRRSLTALELVPGKRVHAQIKSVALL